MKIIENPFRVARAGAADIKKPFSLNGDRVDLKKKVSLSR